MFLMYFYYEFPVSTSFIWTPTNISYKIPWNNELRSINILFFKNITFKESVRVSAILIPCVDVV